MPIAWLDEARCADPLQVGGKAASLARLAVEYRVPPAFAVTTAAFSRWGDVRSSSADEPAPAEMHAAVTAAYRQLADRCADPQPAVAVRSSAIDEDGAAASFAGQHETFLNIVGAEAVVASIVRCWASLDSASASSYREQRGVDAVEAKMGVVVQDLVPADVSGVAFSAHPVSGARDEVVLNASWGLGESVVSGSVTPDSFVVRKGSDEITGREIAAKERMTVRTDGGTREVPVPRIMRSAPSLRDEQIAEVARVAVALEAALRVPVDIEWAFAGDTLFLLQCRPITTLTK
ncbi:MAG: PEP/pyruvate-binding domain-containing protein [Chloroflexi bacterium]|nr:PEP/pyruvate-binding domain-containing protein [Chloroflexota bacterium]